MTRLSIVIPCVQESGSFEATLASVLQNRPEDCEVLVIQPRCYDDPYDLQDEVRFVEAPAGSSLVDLLNVGLEQSSAEIVQLLSCDVEVLDGWTLDALSRFQDPTVGSVSPLIVRKEALEQVVSRGVRYGAGGSRRLCRGHSARNLIVIAQLWRRECTVVRRSWMLGGSRPLSALAWQTSTWDWHSGQLATVVCMRIKH